MKGKMGLKFFQCFQTVQSIYIDPVNTIGLKFLKQVLCFKIIKFVIDFSVI